MAKISHRAAKILAKRIFEKISAQQKEEALVYPKAIQKMIDEKEKIDLEIDKLRKITNHFHNKIVDKGYLYSYDGIKKIHLWKKRNSLTNNLYGLSLKIEEDIILMSEIDKVSMETLEKLLIAKYIKD